MNTNSDTPSQQHVEPLTCRALIVHDWLQGMHGSERVVEVLQRLFVDGADIATFMVDEKRVPATLTSRVVKTSVLPTLKMFAPSSKRPDGRWRFLLPYMPRWFSTIDTSEYDLVISSTHSCAIHAKTGVHTKHIAYVYSPMRYLWQQVADNRGSKVRRSAFRLFSRSLKALDISAGQNPDHIVAISSAVQERIQDAWNRESSVIFPPAAIQEFTKSNQIRGQTNLLWVHRFVDYKKPLEVASAFFELPDLNLTMIGVGELAGQVKAQAPKNVTVLGWLDRDELAEQFAMASGFIHVGEEDFGLSMVEALASGIPVLALNKGGSRDILSNGKFGVMINEATPSQIALGVRDLLSRPFDSQELQEHSLQFSEEQFLRKMSALLRSEGLS